MNAFSCLNQSAPTSFIAQRILSAHPSSPPELLSEEEYKALSAAAERVPKGSELKEVLVILYHTGLRAGELRELRWRDAKLDKRVLVIHSRKDNQCRRVPFASKVLKVLQARRRREPDAQFVFGQRPERVLKQVVTQLSAISPSIRKNPVTLRTLRLTFIARWLHAGGSTAELGLIAGISSHLRNSRSLISFEHLFQTAAKFQAQLEERE